MEQPSISERIDNIEGLLKSLLNRPEPILIQIGLPEYLHAGEVFATKGEDKFTILVLDTCIRTRCGLVHKWTYLRHFGKTIAGKVNDNAEDFIHKNNLVRIGHIKDFLTLPDTKEATE